MKPQIPTFSCLSFLTAEIGRGFLLTLVAPMNVLLVLDFSDLISDELLIHPSFSIPSRKLIWIVSVALFQHATTNFIYPTGPWCKFGLHILENSAVVQGLPLDISATEGEGHWSAIYVAQILPV